MSEEVGYQQWLHVVPSSGRVHQEIQDGEWVVWCTAPNEPPPPELPEGSGTIAGTIGDHRYVLDWTYDGTEMVVNDLDIVLSLDEEIG